MHSPQPTVPHEAGRRRSDPPNRICWSRPSSRHRLRKPAIGASCRHPSRKVPAQRMLLTAVTDTQPERKWMTRLYRGVNTCAPVGTMVWFAHAIYRYTLIMGYDTTSAKSSNQVQVTQGQGLVRDCALVQGAIGYCILLLLVPKMSLTLSNLRWWCFPWHQLVQIKTLHLQWASHATCTGGVFLAPTNIFRVHTWLATMQPPPTATSTGGVLLLYNYALTHGHRLAHCNLHCVVVVMLYVVWCMFVCVYTHAVCNTKHT